MVGVNCHFDMFVALETVKKMKAGLQSAGLNPYLMMQPVPTIDKSDDKIRIIGNLEKIMNC